MERIETKNEIHVKTCWCRIFPAESERNKMAKMHFSAPPVHAVRRRQFSHIMMDVVGVTRRTRLKVIIIIIIITALQSTVYRYSEGLPELTDNLTNYNAKQTTQLCLDLVLKAIGSDSEAMIGIHSEGPLRQIVRPGVPLRFSNSTILAHDSSTSLSLSLALLFSLSVVLL